MLTPRLVMFCFLAFVLSAASALAAPPRPETPEPARIAVVGASVSAGFGASKPLAEALQAALPKARISSHAFLLFSQLPKKIGHKTVDALIEERPNQVVGLDFLFWYGYGPGDENLRLRRFKDGLEELDRLLSEASPALLAIGDLPDMSGARSFMLPAELVPPPQQLAALNEELHHWAKNRPGVLVLPLSEWSVPLHQPDGRVTLPSGATVNAESLLSPDRLHLNNAGQNYVTTLIVRAIEDRAHSQK